jgi:rhodanese-related sulfurtransferase
MILPLTRCELSTWIQQHHPITLIKVGNPEDFDRAHIPGSTHRTEFELVGNDPELSFPDKARPIILYAEAPTDPAARRAAAFLEQRGYQNVYYYEAGQDDWLDAGMPIESDEFTQRTA